MPNRLPPPQGDADESDSLPLVLVAERDEDNLLLLMEALAELPCYILAAVDGKRALRLALTYRPTVILTEIVLPRIDGFELLNRLQQSTPTMTIPVIAVTAMAAEQERSRILSAGFKDHLSKPYGIEELRLLVHQYLL